jgi:hypothetical protein
MGPAAHDGDGGDKSGAEYGDIGQSGNTSHGDDGGRRDSAGRQRTGVCSLCHATETPQWRTGPDGPATLCNACGIRYKMAGDWYLAEHGHRQVPMTASFGREVHVEPPGHSEAHQ